MKYSYQAHFAMECICHLPFFRYVAIGNSFALISSVLPDNYFQNISNSVNTYGTTTRITNGLQQYFLLTFSYYPRKIGKTEIKKQ
jgi:hypothetical protein